MSYPRESNEWHQRVKRTGEWSQNEVRFPLGAWPLSPGDHPEMSYWSFPGECWLRQARAPLWDFSQKRKLWLIPLAQRTTHSAFEAPNCCSSQPDEEERTVPSPNWFWGHRQILHHFPCGSSKWRLGQAASPSRGAFVTAGWWPLQVWKPVKTGRLLTCCLCLRAVMAQAKKPGWKPVYQSLAVRELLTLAKTFFFLK